MKISYSTGVKEYEVEGGTIRFNPSDSEFVKRLWTCMDKLSSLQDDIGSEKAQEAAKANDGKTVFDMIDAKEAEMRSNIDSVFGENASSAIFPDTGLYAIADGLPVWVNFLLAVLDIVEESIGKQENLATPRAEALMRKYKRYM